MKFILFFISVGLCSCATTKIYDNGLMVAKIQCDADNFTFTKESDGSMTLSVTNLNHTNPTNAQGQSAASKIAAAGSAVGAAGVTAILMK